VNQGAPMVAYKESFNNTIEHRETLKKQTGGRGKFADIVFSIGPADEEYLKEMDGKTSFQFVNALFGGSIPKEFVPAIMIFFRLINLFEVFGSVWHIVICINIFIIKIRGQNIYYLN
jgi:translation elongation factor EF-G